MKVAIPSGRRCEERHAVVLLTSAVQPLAVTRKLRAHCSLFEHFPDHYSVKPSFLTYQENP